MGDQYRFGWETVGKRDNIQAYVWYELAASQGSSVAARVKEILAEKMTSEQIAEARRLANDWQPGSCEPEVSKPTAEN